MKFIYTYRSSDGELPAANAQLQSMGIYPLTLPDALRSYQMSLDIDE